MLESVEWKLKEASALSELMGETILHVGILINMLLC